MDHYSPDYKSEKPERLNPRVKISPTGRPYVEKADLVASALKRIKADTGTEVEHARLERAVVEAAKRDRLAGTKGDGSNRDIDAAVQTRRELNAAIDTLIDFEASQENK